MRKHVYDFSFLFNGTVESFEASFECCCKNHSFPRSSRYSYPSWASNSTVGPLILFSEFQDGENAKFPLLAYVVEVR